jgi:hypothetical protein
MIVKRTLATGVTQFAGWTASMRFTVTGHYESYIATAYSLRM